MYITHSLVLSSNNFMLIYLIVDLCSDEYTSFVDCSDNLGIFEVVWLKFYHFCRISLYMVGISPASGKVFALAPEK